MVYRFGNDEILRHPFHAENIVKLFGGRTITYLLEPEAHHFAFIEPFPESIIDSIGLPAYDPPDFDRKTFLDKINRQILDFVTEVFSTQ